MKWQTFGRRPAARLGLLVGGMAVFLASFLVFYPRTIAIMDEDAYLTQAFLFRSGHLTYDNSPVPPPHMTVSTGGRLASKYPPGNSLWLLPFTMAGWHAVFVSGLVLALAGTIIFALLLRELDPEIDPAWALCWLCYPTVVLFSRTVMSDLLAGTAVLVALYFFVRGRAPAVRAAAARSRPAGAFLFLSGLTLGFSVLVRYSNAVLALPFIAILLGQRRSRLRSVLLFGAGLLPFALAALGYNAAAWGGPFRFPMYLTGFFSPVFFPVNAPYYAINLAVLYPLMLAAPFLVPRRHRLLLALPAFTVVLVYCFFSFVYEVPNFAERLTVGMRYLLSALPFFVAAFCLVGEELVRRVRGFAVAKYAGLALLVVLSVAIQYRHHRHLRVQEDYRRLLYAHLPPDGLLVCNNNVSELVGWAWGWREWRHFSEFDVPMDLDSVLGAAPKLYAAMLDRPGDDRFPERAVFNSILVKFPARELLAETSSPERFRLYRLR